LKKRYVILFLIILLIAFSVFTNAYFHKEKKIENVFNTATYGNKIVEEFESPDNWLPGTTTDKKIYVTNTGSTPIAVRALLEESWLKEDNTSLPLKKDGISVAVINLSSSTNWVNQDNYYYYKVPLYSDETSDNFIESVTFNEEVTGDYNCVTENNIEKCTMTNDYAGATYKLKVIIETVQYDQAENLWNVKISDL